MWGESGRAIGLCGLSAIKIPLNGRCIRASLGGSQAQSTALSYGPAIALSRALRQIPARWCHFPNIRDTRGEMRESATTANILALPVRPVRGAPVCLLAMAILSLMFLSVAMWNGFPLIFYDTGAYILEGLGHVFLVERAPVYAELLFLAGARFSLWPIVVLQALMTSAMILAVARAEVPGLTLRGVGVIGAFLSVFTGLAWYVGQVEPDIFTPMVMLGSWLLLFRSDRLSKAALRWVIGLTGLAVACHPSHLGLLGGLLICAGALK